MFLNSTMSISNRSTHCIIYYCNFMSMMIKHEIGNDNLIVYFIEINNDT